MRYLDSRIALLIQNRMALDEVRLWSKAHASTCVHTTEFTSMSLSATRCKPRSRKRIPPTAPSPTPGRFRSVETGFLLPALPCLGLTPRPFCHHIIAIFKPLLPTAIRTQAYRVPEPVGQPNGNRHLAADRHVHAIRESIRKSRRASPPHHVPGELMTGVGGVELLFDANPLLASLSSLLNSRRLPNLGRCCERTLPCLA